MDHLERNADDELQDEIIGNMNEPFVEEGIRQKSPGFPTATGIVDEGRVKWRRSRERKLFHRYAIVKVTGNLDQRHDDDEERGRTAGVILVVAFRRHGLNGPVDQPLRQIQMIHFQGVFLTENDIAKLLKNGQPKRMG